MRHVGDSLLGAVYRLDDLGSEFLQALGDTMFLGRGFTAGSLRFGLGGDVSVRVEATDRAVAFA